MLNVTSISSASDAQKYFEQDNYYSQDEGYAKSFWGGQGAEILGLQGNIKAEPFKDLLEGKVGAQELGRDRTNPETGAMEKEHRPGWDLTFSAPKSVPFLGSRGDNRLRAAHEAAVAKAMDYVEREGGFARVNGGMEQTGNLVWAAFQHDTSRALDPQTHTHVVVMNATVSPTAGEWRSLSSEQLYNLQKSADAIYQNELAKGAQELGYQVEWSGRSFEIGGVSRDQIEIFSKRTEQISEALAERGMTRGTSSAEARDVAALKTRDGKVEADRDELREGWREEARAAGIDIQGTIEKTRDPEQRPTVERINPDLAVAKAIAHLGQREHVFEKRDLVEWANRFSEGRVGSEAIRGAIFDAQREGRVIEANGKWTTPDAIRAELKTIDLVEGGRGQVSALTTQTTAEKLIGSWEKQSGRELNAGQREAALAIVGSSDRIIGIQGHAGVGKTTMLSAVKHVADNSNTQVVGIAPTTEAARVMGGELGVKTDTVAKFIAEHSPEQAQADTQRLVENIDRAMGHMERQHSAAWDRQIQSENRAAERLESGGQRPDFMGGSVGFDKQGGMYVSTADGWRQADLGDVFVAAGVKAAEQLAHLGQEAAKTIYEAAKAEIGRATLEFKQSHEREKLEGFKERAQNATTRDERLGVQRDFMKYQVEKLEKVASGMRERAWNARENSPKAPMSPAGAERWKEVSGARDDLARESMKTAHDALMGRAADMKEQIGKIEKELEGAQAQKLVVVDEASLLSSRDANKIMEIANREGMRVVFQGDVRQLQAVEAGKAFQNAKDFAGFSKAEMTDIQRQKTELGKEVVADIYRGKPQEAFDRLEKGGKVHVGEGHGDTIKKLASDLASGTKEQRESALVMTASRADRDAINQAVRDAYQQTGDIGKESVKVEAWRSRGLTDAQKTQAGQYHRGDGLEFGMSNKAIGINAGERGVITDKNTAGNTLTVQMQDGRSVQFDPKEARGMDTYERRTIEVAQGDKLRFSKNDLATGRTNGEVGHVRELKGQEAKIEFRGADGKSYTDTVNLGQARHVDHGYAMTVHSSQGKTVGQENTSAIYINPDNPNLAMGQRSFLVGATRGQDAVSVYTHQKQEQQSQNGSAREKAHAAVKEIMRPQDKSSAIREVGMDKAREFAKQTPPTQQVAHANAKVQGQQQRLPSDSQRQQTGKTDHSQATDTKRPLAASKSGQDGKKSEVGKDEGKSSAAPKDRGGR